MRAEITVPGSKSITNRALILAALAEGEVSLEGALWSEDTQIMVECLQELGFMVDVRPDPNEFCNRTITVYGKAGIVPPGGTEQQPMELFVGNAGTAARFLAAFVCLGKGVYRLEGVPRMHERPQGALFRALRELGYRVEPQTGEDRLPVIIHGTGWKPGTCHVNITESSQFASALLLGAKVGGWDIRITGEDTEEAPYVEMTRRLTEAFPRSGGNFQIEPDASSGSYFWAADWLASVDLWTKDPIEDSPHPQIQFRLKEVSQWIRTASSTENRDPEERTTLDFSIRHWPSSGWQIDADFPLFLPLPETISREHQLGDSIMTAIVIAAHILGGFGYERRQSEIRFVDLNRLRLQETERVVALRTELTKCGAKVDEEGDTLTVFPSELHGAEIETYNDHRMAMCFAILGLKVPSIKIKNPACVKKTFPNFFQKLAAAPPKGLGATILDAKSGRKLTHDELFAE